MQRRPRTVLILTATIVATVLATATLPAMAGSRGAERTRGDEPKSQRKRFELRLRCARAEDRPAAVTCEWSASEDRAFAGYKLWRATYDPAARDDASRRSGRQVIFTTRDRRQVRHVDTTVERNKGYGYAVEAVDAQGRTLAHSQVAKVGPADRPAKLALGCERTDPKSVACHWTQSDHAAFASYRLERAPVERTESGGARHGEPHTIFTSQDRTVTRFLDSEAPSSHGWVYRLAVLDSQGHIVAASEPVGIRPAGDSGGTGDRPAPVRFACAGATDANGPAVTCKWSRSEAPAFGAYRMWRKAEGAERAALATIPDRDTTSYVDRTAHSGTTYTYAVEVLDHEGRTITHSEPVTVRCCPSGENAPSA